MDKSNNEEQLNVLREKLSKQKKHIDKLQKKQIGLSRELSKLDKDKRRVDDEIRSIEKEIQEIHESTEHTDIDELEDKIQEKVKILALGSSQMSNYQKATRSREIEKLRAKKQHILAAGIDQMKSSQKKRLKKLEREKSDKTSDYNDLVDREESLRSELGTRKENAQSSNQAIKRIHEEIKKLKLMKIGYSVDGLSSERTSNSKKSHVNRKEPADEFPALNSSQPLTSRKHKSRSRGKNSSSKSRLKTSKPSRPPPLPQPCSDEGIEIYATEERDVSGRLIPSPPPSPPSWSSIAKFRPVGMGDDSPVPDRPVPDRPVPDRPPPFSHSHHVSRVSPPYRGDQRHEDQLHEKRNVPVNPQDSAHRSDNRAEGETVPRRRRNKKKRRNRSKRSQQDEQLSSSKREDLRNDNNLSLEIEHLRCEIEHYGDVTEKLQEEFASGTVGEYGSKKMNEYYENLERQYAEVHEDEIRVLMAQENILHGQINDSNMVCKHCISLDELHLTQFILMPCGHCFCKECVESKVKEEGKCTRCLVLYEDVIELDFGDKL